MKKLTLLLGIGALTLASCSNDDLVNDTSVNETANPAIGFAVSTGNMSRATGDPTQLSEEHWDFGVWGYKSTTENNNIMSNYLVGYWDITNQEGYKPKNSQELFGTNVSSYAWYYEGLGSEEANDSWTDAEGGIHTNAYFEFVPGLPGEKVATSKNQYQYLKYWDRAAGIQNWFYACAPYYADATFDYSTHKLTFPVISSVKDENAMYAATKIASPGSSPATNTYVDLNFNRLLAQVRLGFYEEVAGYSVELIDYSSKVSIPTDDLWSDFGTHAMYAVPAIKNGVLYDKSEYVTSAKPVITFGDPDLITATNIEYTEQSKSSDNINIPLWFFSGNTQTNVLGTTKNDAIINQPKNVLPQSASSNCGFTINLSLKFTSLDTGEVILVKGVRVNIPAEHCRWEANHRYTYYFKVTKNVPGSPDEPETTSEDPGNDPYLLPIVFDNVTVQAIEVSDADQHEYPLN